MFILIVILVFLGPAPAVSHSKQGYRALSFGTQYEDYIEFRPEDIDMSPFASSFTLCTWMKRLYKIDSILPIAFHYTPGEEIAIGGNGYFNYVQQDNIDLRGKLPEANVWFHYCLSWAARRTQIVYINGVEVGSRAASSDDLTLGGWIALGNVAFDFKAYVYGGELHKVNMFSEQLTSYQIREIAYSGMCSDVEEKYETRRLKWEEILSKERHGNVSEFVPEECAVVYINYLDTKLTQTEARLRETDIELKETKKTLGMTHKRLIRELDRRERKCGAV